MHNCTGTVLKLNYGSLRGQIKEYSSSVCVKVVADGSYTMWLYESIQLLMRIL